MLNSSSNKFPEQQNRLQPLKQLIYAHPLAFWGCLWVALVLVSSVATVGLLNPGSIETEKPQQRSSLTAVPEFKEEKTKEEDLPIVSLVGFLALGCGAGSLLVTQALKQSTKSPPSTRDFPAAIPVRRKQHSHSPPKRRRKVIKRQGPVSQDKTISQVQDYQEPRNTNPVAEITVLPPQEIHPLDSQEASLAEMMDLRKRQSLSSLMRGE
ncbi:MAG: hypothetical protein WA919_08995 [Coleofasciculaceae cyanobacterium]